MDLMVGALAFVAAALAVLGLASVFQTPAANRLQRVSRSARVETVSEAPSLFVQRATGVRAWFERVGGGQKAAQGPVHERLTQAGYRHPSAAPIYYGVRVVSAVGLPIAATLVPATWGLPAPTAILILCGLAAVGYVGPSAVLDRLVLRRQSRIERALPDALDLLVVCVEAGYGINQALARIAEDFAARSLEIAQEFALVVNETRTGKTTTAALQGLADRTGVSDVTSLVALLVQTEKFGTSVATALRVHADAMRIQRMQRAEQRAQMATLKLILPSTLIFAALLILFITPAALRVIEAMKAQ
jgi:tight adherence protein C